MDWTFWLHWLYYVALVVLLVTGLFVNILGLPGLWVMVLAHVLFGWATGWDRYVGLPSTIAVVVLAGIAEVVEFVAGAAGSKAAGGSKRGMIGAVVGGLAGGILGTPLLPVIGTIAGAVIGAGLGAFLVEIVIGKTQGDSITIGIGAAKGRFFGIVAKSAFGVAILLVSMIAAPPIGRPSPAALPPFTVPTTLPASTAPATPSTEPAPAIER